MSGAAGGACSSVPAGVASAAASSAAGAASGAVGEASAGSGEPPSAGGEAASGALFPGAVSVLFAGFELLGAAAGFVPPPDLPPFPDFAGFAAVAPFGDLGFEDFALFDGAAPVPASFPLRRGDLEPDFFPREDATARPSSVVSPDDFPRSTLSGDSPATDAS
ncbi:hypothetical protein [Streptomyces sp. WMMB 714]|uniref:hypothetical protein n=1 Tax=Streptomyces sp. WMMB 714 TaxID=1286822 RepID=UPI0006989002|nr:hypothetical protein [Streptomyces sp. WMMB 714]